MHTTQAYKAFIVELYMRLRMLKGSSQLLSISLHLAGLLYLYCGVAVHRQSQDFKKYISSSAVTNYLEMRKTQRLKRR